MNRTILFTVCGLLAAAGAGAQNAYDAGRVLGSELNGTARFVGMGGAMSALGGDVSVMGTNPAGLGIFRSNDISVSFGFNNTGTESRFNGNTMKEDRTRASFDQVGIVYSNKIGNTTSLRYVNFGFNYHKSKNFNHIFSAGGMLDGLSQSWQLAQAMDSQLGAAGITGPSSFYDQVVHAQNPYTDQWNRLPVLSVLGATTGVVDWPQGYDRVLGWDGYNNNYYSQQTGGINQYDFSVAFNLEDRFYLGLTLGVSDLKYDLYSSYTENVNDDNGADNGGYTLENYYRLTGTGLNLKLGAIVRPFEESPFRIGLAVHTPTWYDLSESYDAVLNSDIYAYDDACSQTLSANMHPDYLAYDYRMVTPWKFNVSAGTTLAGVVAVGAEYEYEDYSTAKLKDMDGYELGDQASVEEFLKGVSTFRVGMEARLTPAVSLRAGYNYTTAAYDKSAYSALSLYSTRTAYANTQSRNTATCGIGYRGGLFYADLAYKYDFYKSDFYAFDDVDLPATKVDNTRHQLLLTMGVRF